MRRRWTVANVPIENFDVELSVASGPGTSAFNVVMPPIFTFPLCRQSHLVGDFTLDQCWIDRKRLFPTASQPASHFQTVVDYFWQACVQGGTSTDAGAQDVYLLASLLPDIRRQGSRRIVDDGIASARGKRWVSHRLEPLIGSTSNGEMGLAEFRDKTAKLIGPEVIPPPVAARYEIQAEKLLKPAREVIRSDGQTAAASFIREQWKTWVDEGRHADRESLLLLDILSFEVRTAFCQCYSQVWCGLIPFLRERLAWDVRNERFHTFWHLEKRLPSAESAKDDFHLFHGLPFALHPASGFFMKTDAGQHLMARWLGDPTPRNFGRLLQGLFIALDAYSDHRQEDRHLRRAGGLVGPAALDFLEAPYPCDKGADDEFDG
jgi:hypothetical protein